VGCAATGPHGAIVEVQLGQRRRVGPRARARGAPRRHPPRDRGAGFTCSSACSRMSVVAPHRPSSSAPTSSHAASHALPWPRCRPRSAGGSRLAPVPLPQTASLVLFARGLVLFFSPGRPRRRDRARPACAPLTPARAPLLPLPSPFPPPQSSSASCHVISRT